MPAQVGDFYTCMQCNGKGRALNSLHAVRNHMLDKGHVFIDTSEEGQMEISEYYDFRLSGSLHA
jgi:pre-60S factor REI1